MENKEITKNEEEQNQVVEKKQEKLVEARLHIELFEDNQRVVAIAPVPGCDQQSVDIELNQNELKITALPAEPNQENDLTQIYQEFKPRKYIGLIKLGASIDVENITANIKNGELTLLLPKKKPELKKISINAIN